MNKPLNSNDIMLLILSVWIESSEGIHSTQAIEWMTWVSINRYKNYFSKQKVFLDRFHDSLYSYSKQVGFTLDQIVGKFLKSSHSNHESFMKVYDIAMSVYGGYLFGEDDPTSGSIFFVHATKDNTGTTYPTTEAARNDIKQKYNLMASKYNSEMAKVDGQLSPFTFAVSDIYSVPGQGEMFLLVGNNLCVSATSCGANWLNYQPIQ